MSLDLVICWYLSVKIQSLHLDQLERDTLLLQGCSSDKEGEGGLSSSSHERVPSSSQSSVSTAPTRLPSDARRSPAILLGSLPGNISSNINIPDHLRSSWTQH